MISVNRSQNLSTMDSWLVSGKSILLLPAQAVNFCRRKFWIWAKISGFGIISGVKNSAANSVLSLARLYAIWAEAT